jgi:hypothetical protein
MMSAQLIKDVSDVAAYRAAEEDRKPLSIWSERDSTHIPFLGDYVPEGWRIAKCSELVEQPGTMWHYNPDEEVTFMVDSSGFGSPGEPALTIPEFGRFAVASGMAWAIREAGQFQIVVSPYIEDPESPGVPAPSEDDVICKECHTIHDGLEECDFDPYTCEHESVDTRDEADGVAFGGASRHEVNTCLNCGADLYMSEPDEDGQTHWEVED